MNLIEAIVILILVGFVSIWSFVFGFGKGYDAGLEDGAEIHHADD